MTGAPFRSTVAAYRNFGLYTDFSLGFLGYTFGKLLGEGSYARVKVTECPNKQTAACKMICKKKAPKVRLFAKSLAASPAPTRTARALPLHRTGAPHILHHTARTMLSVPYQLSLPLGVTKL